MNRRHRLRGRGRFAAVRASGVETRSGGIRVRAAANGLPISRAGFAIMSAPHAVARNRLRRRLRALVAPIVSHHPGVDIVVSAPAALDAVAANALRDAVVPLVSGAIAEARGR
ncbi:MAG: ribonuclease P protein component [Chloroflexi bacterium]|nr:MAG: ribonuclease P protein component [Chloroflexota bacterium]